MSSRKPALVARGFRFTAELRKAVLCIDNDTFEQIRSLAVKRNQSFAAVARDLLELGLETLAMDAAR